MPGGSAKKKGRASPTQKASKTATAAPSTPSTPTPQQRRRRAPTPPPHSGDDRAAATALFFLIMLQAPVLILSGERLPISPLELAAGAAVAQWPERGGAAEATAHGVLLPGSWLKTALVPWAACALSKGEVAELRRKHVAGRKAEGLWDEEDEEKEAKAKAKTTDNDPCQAKRALLADPAAALAAADVLSLAKRVSEARDAPALAAGAALLAASALLGRVFSARSALIGVVLIAAGGVRGGHTLLPPLWMMGFLAAYAAFGGALERRLAGGGGAGVKRAPAHERARRAAESVVLPEEDKGKGDKAAAAAGAANGNGGGASARRRVTFEG